MCVEQIVLKTIILKHFYHVGKYWSFVFDKWSTVVQTYSQQVMIQKIYFCFYFLVCFLVHNTKT